MLFDLGFDEFVSVGLVFGDLSVSCWWVWFDCVSLFLFCLIRLVFGLVDLVVCFVFVFVVTGWTSFDSCWWCLDWCFVTCGGVILVLIF